MILNTLPSSKSSGGILGGVQWWHCCLQMKRHNDGGAKFALGFELFLGNASLFDPRFHCERPESEPLLLSAVALTYQHALASVFSCTFRGSNASIACSTEPDGLLCQRPLWGLWVPRTKAAFVHLHVVVGVLWISCLLSIRMGMSPNVTKGVPPPTEVAGTRARTLPVVDSLVAPPDSILDLWYSRWFPYVSSEGTLRDVTGHALKRLLKLCFCNQTIISPKNRNRLLFKCES